MRKLSIKKVLFPVLSVALAILFIAGCGQTGSQTTGIPTAGAGGPGPTTPPSPLPPNPVNPTPGIPDLTNVAVIALDNNVTYQGLIDIAGNIVTPIVGDPKLLLKITNTRQQAVEGTLRLAFEDKIGLWVADLVSVPKSGVNTSSNLDILFTDDALTIRISSSRLGDNLLSNIYYRVRQSGENQCLPSKCYVTFGGTRYEVPFGSAWCPIAQPDTVGICRNYMNPSTSNPAVKRLGTFSVKYTDIAVLPEGN